MSLRSSLVLSKRTLPGFVAIGLCWGSIAALIPQLKAQIGAGDAQFGMLLLASALGLVSAMWLAPLADERLRRFGLPCAAALLAVLFPLLGLAGSPGTYAAIMLFLGIASGLTDVIVNARVSDNEAAHNRPLMNVNHAAFSFAYAIAALVAGFGREVGLPPVAILALPALAILVLTPTMIVAPGSVEAQTSPDDRSLAGRGILICGAIVLVGFGAEAAVESWSALHVERTLAGRAAEGALGPAMLGVTMGIGRLLGQTAAERLNDLSVLRWAAALSAMGAVLAALAPSPPLAYLGFAIAGFGISVIGPLGIALAGRLATASTRTKAISRAAVIGFCGFFVAPPTMGVVAELSGLRAAFIAIALGLLLVFPLTLAVSRRLRPFT